MLKNESQPGAHRFARVRGMAIALALVTSAACGSRGDRDAIRQDTVDSRTTAKGTPVAVATPSVSPASTLDESSDAERVGQHVPETLSSMGSPVALMESASFRDSSDERALFHVAVGGEHEEVWLLEHLPRTRPDDPTGWKVVATLAPRDSLSSALRLMLSCARGGTPNPRLISEVVWEDIPTLKKIPRAWEVRGREIVGVPATGITCHNEIVPD